MEHKKDIGKAIKDKLDALDKTPGDHLWAAIEADLPKKKKRRILPFWISLASIAVIGLLLWSLFGHPENSRFKNDNAIENGNNPTNTEATGEKQNNIGNSATANENGQAAQPEKGTNKNGSKIGEDGSLTGGPNTVKQHDENGNETLNSENTSSPNKTKRSAKSQKQSFATKNSLGRKNIRKSKTGNRLDALNAANTSRNETGLDRASQKQATDQNGIAETSENRTSEKANGITTGTQSKPIGDVKPSDNAVNDSVAKASAKEKNKKNEKPKDSLAKQELETAAFKTFSIFLYVAPTYYDTFSKISSLDRRLDSLPRKAEITYSYGGYLVFDYNDKWAFRFGVARTNLRHRTTGIPVSSLNQQNYYNIDYDNISNADLQARFADSERFDLIQDISYFEIPIELKYKFIDGKFGIDGIGGISTNFLSSNSVTAESDNSGSVVIGSTKDQYKAYFSANIGAGFYWRFADNFRLNVEPIFKYHFRTASTALQPYSVVVLGGLEYTFNWRTKKKADKK
jgi:hypothetical protein